MSEYLTLQNMTTLITVLLTLEMILRRVAPMTTTDLDDKALIEIDKAKSWAVSMAPAVYAIIEGLAKSGKIPAASKAQAFAAELAQAYQKANGAPLPAQAHAEAETVARGLAAADKLTVNPPPAPSK